MRILTWLLVCFPACSQVSLTIVSAASGSSTLAKESIASAYGRTIAFRTESATSIPLPTSLGGINLQVIDSQGITRLAPLYYVAPAQINFQVPAGTASGVAKIHVLNGTATTVTGTAQIANVAPGLFTAGSNGTGPVAGYGVRTAEGSEQSIFSIFQCDARTCGTIPIDLGLDGPVYLALFGTGLRSRSSLQNVNVTVNGTKAVVYYAGPQSEFAGLDQLNIAFPLGLHGTGDTNLLLTVDGISANAVRINIR